jgi:hypothetical protein
MVILKFVFTAADTTREGFAKAALLRCSGLPVVVCGSDQYMNLRGCYEE